MGYERHRYKGLIRFSKISYDRRETATWAKVIDARNGESYFASLMESKDRARKRQRPNPKNNLN